MLPTLWRIGVTNKIKSEDFIDVYCTHRMPEVDGTVWCTAIFGQNNTSNLSMAVQPHLLRQNVSTE